MVQDDTCEVVFRQPLEWVGRGLAEGRFLFAAPLAVALCYIIAYYFHKLPLVRNIF